jgi:polyvinyl alcohol dehydrogenase (cytochrome)
MSARRLLLAVALVLLEAPGAAAGDWPSWQYSPDGSRYNPSGTSITAADVGGLQPRWAFVFPHADAASSQPAVVGSTVYVGSHSGVMYALDARTGAVRWAFDTQAVPPALQTFAPPLNVLAQTPLFGNHDQQNMLRDGPAVSGGVVYFGDSQANMYALDAATGALVWKTNVDSFRHAWITSSPLVYGGMMYVGVSSSEETVAAFPNYACCQFRGSVVALDARTGRIVWRHYTVPPPVRDGTNALGVPQYAPNGGAVWASPAINPATDTLYVGTGNNYSPPTTAEEDAIVALDARTGALRWRHQLTSSDAWNFGCVFGEGRLGNCPHSGPDWDFGASPNLFRAGGRTLVGEGQKSGIYWALDATTGRVVWHTLLSTAHAIASLSGIQWGSAYDRRRLYVTTYEANPGQLFALDPATGRVVWHTPNPSDGCSGSVLEIAAGALLDCQLAIGAPPSAIPGVVFAGSVDGKLRAYDSATGNILWHYDTARSVLGTDGIWGAGGSINSAGPVISNGFVYTNSGYNIQEEPTTGMDGNVLFAFALPGASGTSFTTARPSSRSRGTVRACLSAWRDPLNRSARAGLRAVIERARRRDPRGRPLVNMVADGRRCLLTVRIPVRRGKPYTLDEALTRSSRFVPADPQYAAAAVPISTANWNLDITRDGRLSLRHPGRTKKSLS